MHSAELSHGGAGPTQEGFSIAHLGTTKGSSCLYHRIEQYRKSWKECFRAVLSTSRVTRRFPSWLLGLREIRSGQCSPEVFGEFAVLEKFVRRKTDAKPMSDSDRRVIQPNVNDNLALIWTSSNSIVPVSENFDSIVKWMESCTTRFSHWRHTMNHANV